MYSERLERQDVLVGDQSERKPKRTGNEKLKKADLAGASGWSTPTMEAPCRCVELALEGERLCRVGDTQSGIAYLENALTTGTDDLRTLSAIYSQLGNAYFYMADYVKALEYHRHDLTLARTIGDKLGEAKASGNLGNTLKVLGKFDEAILCCQRHLDISRELGDRVGESRALYNIGNVYHAKGKHIGRMSNSENGEFPVEVRTCLQKAVEFYEDNLVIVKELGDRAAEGRACGNLGNTYYLLGDFRNAVSYHVQRLDIAKEFGDKPAMRRAYSNLGNAHVFLVEFDQAIEYYQLALSIAVELADQATEAQACYSLANTYNLIGEYTEAVKFHLRHLKIARALNDRVGQTRASWSLGSAYTSLGDHSKALYFVTLHWHLSREIGDQNGEALAYQNWSDLTKLLGPTAIPDSSADPEPVEFTDVDVGIRRIRRLKGDTTSGESDDWHSSTTGSICNNAQRSADSSPKYGNDSRRMASASHHGAKVSPDDACDEESFFELLSRAQSKRMDDQRCDPRALAENKENRPRVRATDNLRGVAGAEQGPEDFLEMIAGMQSRRMDDQRAALPYLPGLQHPAKVLGPHILKQKENASTQPKAEQKELDDDFIDMLIRCQSTRIDEQRSELPLKNNQTSVTVPDDDFFQLLLKMQARRFEEQRADLHLQDEETTEEQQSGTEPSSPDKLPHKRTASQKIKKR